MANEPTIDLDPLLAPIPGENPAGENLLYAGLHDQIREARRSEDDLAQGDWQHQIKVADWRTVAGLATDALSARTKDLQVSAWLAEALIKLHGFAGLRDSLKLMRGLLERFWDQVYPEIDDGDLDARANALSFLDRQAAFVLKEVPITNSIVGTNLTYFQWQESTKFEIPERLEDLSDEEQERAKATREQAANEGKLTSEQWRIAKNASRRAYYEETHALLKECSEEYKALDHAMDEKFKDQTPGLGALRKTLEDVSSVVEKIVKEKRVLEPDAVAAETAAPGTEMQEAGAGVEVPATGAVGPIRSRQDALKRLAEVSEYFRKTEPHSPVAYLVQRAIRWGEMPLDLWLEDVIKEPMVLEHLRETLGLKAGGASQS